MADELGKVLYEKVIYEDNEKAMQYRVTVSEFRGVQYLNIRKYFLSFDDGYLPTKEGATMPLSIYSTYNLFSALYDILSDAEKVELKQKLLEIDEENKEPF